MTSERKAHSGDVTGEAWNFCVSYLTLMQTNAPPEARGMF